MSKKFNDSELESWAGKLPRKGTPEIPRASLERISFNVATGIARDGNGRLHWQKVWQPVFATSLTMAIAAWLIVGIPNHAQIPVTNSGGSGLLAAFAPMTTDDDLSMLSVSDIDTLLSGITATTSTPSNLVKDISAIEFDSDAAVSNMTPAERKAILNTLSDDRNLDWSELL